MKKFLIYNFPGEIDDLSHLFPNERLAQLAAVIKSAGAAVEIWDRSSIYTHQYLRPLAIKRRYASLLAAYMFRKISRNRPLNKAEKILFGLPLRSITGAMARELEQHYAAFIRKEAQRILQSDFSGIFLNLWRGGFGHTMELARLLKEHSSLPLYAVGQRVDWAKDFILRLYPQLDVVILGLGYDSARRLVLGEQPANIPNLIIRKKNGEFIHTVSKVVDINSLPPACYENSIYKGIEGLIPLMHISLSNQACPQRCTFCVRPQNYGCIVIGRPISRVVDELQELIASLGVRYFRVADSTPPPLALTEFSREIVKRGLHKQKVHFSAFARVDVNKREDFSLLKEANCEALFFGIESLDEDNLKRIRKGITYEHIKQTLKQAHDAGIFTVGSFIYPLPGETRASKRNILRRLKEISPYLDSALVMPAGVYPCSEWGKNPQEHKIFLPTDYIKRIANYPIKYITPLRFWPPFPFSYDLMGKPAAEVQFEDIVSEFEDFTHHFRRHLCASDIQDYAILVAKMLDIAPLKLVNNIKKALLTRDYNTLEQIVIRTRGPY